MGSGQTLHPAVASFQATQSRPFIATATGRRTHQSLVRAVIGVELGLHVPVGEEAVQTNDL